jgi:hypothetical protein
MLHSTHGTATVTLYETTDTPPFTYITINISPPNWKPEDCNRVERASKSNALLLGI